MSKSRGNVINPDEIIEEFGADAFRIYEMFLGPLARRVCLVPLHLCFAMLRQESVTVIGNVR